MNTLLLKANYSAADSWRKWSNTVSKSTLAEDSFNSIIWGKKTSIYKPVKKHATIVRKENTTSSFNASFMVKNW